MILRTRAFAPSKLEPTSINPVPPLGILEIRIKYSEKKSAFSGFSRNSQSSVSSILEGHWLQVTHLEGKTRENRNVRCKASSLSKSNILLDH